MKVISCFSYKGGAGRTTAAANIAAALSSIDSAGSVKDPLQRKVALIDLDVFSAGTHRVFEIDHKQINDFNKDHPCVQDYLREQMAPGDYVEKGGITLGHAYMEQFRSTRGGQGNCHPGFTLFPAKPDPDARFVVQKQHENVLIELLMELESKNHAFDYVILDGESGIRQMADIAMRLADVVLMFFRLTWQHIEGTLNYGESFLQKSKPFYLVPSCVPVVDNTIYKDTAAGLGELIRLTEMIPENSRLNDFAGKYKDKAGHFWAQRGCIHDSLCLKGEERIVVFDTGAREDQAANDFYNIAREINRLHPPSD